MSVTLREGAIDSKRAHVQTRSLSSRAENADRDNRQKNISLYRNAKRLLSYSPLYSCVALAYMHINTEKIIFSLSLHFLCIRDNVLSTRA